MKFKIVVMPIAKSDLKDHGDLIARDSKDHATKWLAEAGMKMLSLQEMPKRFAVIPEAEEIGTELRSLLHYSHRIIYKVDELQRTVEIIRVWHQARRPLRPSDLN